MLWGLKEGARICVRDEDTQGWVSECQQPGEQDARDAQLSWRGVIMQNETERDDKLPPG